VLHECLTGFTAVPRRQRRCAGQRSHDWPDTAAQRVRSGIPKAFDAVIAREWPKRPRPLRQAAIWRGRPRSTQPDPDQDHADNILRRSREATLPGTAEIHHPGPLSPTPRRLDSHTPTRRHRRPAEVRRAVSPPAQFGSGASSWADQSALGPRQRPVPTPSHAAPQYSNWGVRHRACLSHNIFPDQFREPGPRPTQAQPWPIIAAISLVFVVASAPWHLVRHPIRLNTAAASRSITTRAAERVAAQTPRT